MRNHTNVVIKKLMLTSQPKERLSSMAASSSKVDFTSSRLTGRGIRYEIPALLTNPSVKELHLPINRLDEACTKCIVMMLKRDDICPQIEELHLSHTQSDENCNRNRRDAPFVQIISSLKTSTRIKKLVISISDMNASEISAVASILYDIKSLKKLVLRQCGIDHKAATKIFCALASNTSVESLDLSNNPLGNRGASALCVALDISTTMKKLKISETQLGIEGAVAIGAALTKNSSLEVLDMSKNPIGDMGVSKVAIALKSNNSLRQLGLRQTSMSDVGALCIMLSLYDSKNLGAILSSNHSIRYLNLNNNELSRKSLIDIETVCKMNLLQTEKDTIRQKVAFFLNDKSKISCFGGDMSLKCMPYLLSAIGNAEQITSLYNVVRSVNMPQMFQSKPDSCADSLFSDDNNIEDHKNSGSVPTFIEVESCHRGSSPP